MKDGSYIKFKKKYRQSTYDKCFDFAEECYETNKDEYKKRGQHDPDTIKKQIKMGKIVEILTGVFGESMGFDCPFEADFEIYRSYEDKSFFSDLQFAGEEAKKYFDIGKDVVNVSCKASYYRMGDSFTEYRDGTPIRAVLPRQYSWTYQLKNKNGVGGTDKGEHDVYIFGIVDEEVKSATLYAWVKKPIVEKMFVKPYKRSLKDTKLVIQEKTCGKERQFPCGIDELLSENYEYEKPI